MESEPCSKKVFALRREEKFEEALEAGRDCYERNPNDPWAKRALGWVLYDHITSCLEDGELDQAAEYLHEFDEMEISKDDDVIHENIDRLRRQIKSPGIRKARQAAKKEDYNTAVDYYRTAFRQHAESDDLKTEFGWAIRNRIKQLTRVDSPPIGQIHQLAQEFADVEPPQGSNLYSALLSDLVRVAEQWRGYLQFLHWWNPNLFVDDHYKPYVSESGSTYPSLAYKTLRAAGIQVLEQQSQEAAQWLIPFLEEVLERGWDEDLIWVEYDLGRLYRLNGDLTQAREYLGRVVRQKFSEPWAWHHFAQACDTTQDQRDVLCAALKGADNNTFVLSIREDLAALLIEQDMYAEAKREILDLVSVREDEEYDIPKRVKEWQASDWYAETEVVESNATFYEQHAEQGRERVLQDVPWIAGIVTGHQEASDQGPARTFIGIQEGSSELTDIPVRDREHKVLGSLQKGTPVEVHSDGDSVFGIRERDGEPWDLLESTVAVVEHVNHEKDVTHLILTRRRDALAYHDRTPEVEDATAGDSLEVRTVENQPGRPEIIVSAQPTEKDPPSTILRSFSGHFQFPHDGRRHFGFVNDYYVHKSLIESHGLEDNALIEGRAILSDPDEGKWRVLDLKVVDDEAT